MLARALARLVVISALVTPFTVPKFAHANTEDFTPLTVAASSQILRDYVQRPDRSFQRQDVTSRRSQGERFTTYLVDFTSLTWRSAAEVDRPLWSHRLIIVVPDKLRTSQALLYIRGGLNTGKSPEEASSLVSDLAVQTGGVGVELAMVPNAPLEFQDEPRPHIEDDIIAYSWKKYLDTLDPEWIALFPMVKSAVNAMTLAQDFVHERTGKHIDKFVVTGASKRGWTSWLTAVADPRVVAIAPVVIDVLNAIPSMRHHHRVYGFWAPAIWDYENHGITARLGEPAMKDLIQLIDPYSFRAELTLPKMIINAANDEFFLPDSSQFYFAELQGEKSLRYIPNSGHAVRYSEISSNLLPLFQSVDKGVRLPKLQWHKTGETSVEIHLDTPARSVRVWEASNAKGRDFRLSENPPPYVAKKLRALAEGSHEIAVAAPQRGFKAWFVEVEFAPEGISPYKVTTEVFVTKAQSH